MSRHATPLARFHFAPALPLASRSIRRFTPARHWTR